jgi:NitT/TauT family transport system substrate-binding protein
MHMREAWTAGRIIAMSARRAGQVARAALVLALALSSRVDAAEIKINFALDRPLEGPAAPFLLPLDTGWYKAEGLNVSVATTAGVTEPIAGVASGLFEMGIADINALIKFRDANPDAPVRSVFIVYNRPAYAVIGRKSRGITVPRDLEGKKLGAPVGDSTFVQWPIFVKANGIDGSKVKIEHVGPAVREPMLTAGQVDAVTGLSYSFYVNLKDKGVPIDDVVVLMMANYGVDLYGDAIIVNTKFAAEHPEAVRGFLRAFLRALKLTINAPARAVDVVLKHDDTIKRELEIERLRMVIRDNIVTPEVKAQGLGGVDAGRFAHAIEQIELTYKFKNEKPKLGDIFEASYLPPASERKIK